MTEKVTIEVDTYELPPFDEFVSRVTEMYAHNIVHHPDANPTLNEAFHEVLTDMIDEVIDIQEREAKDGLPDCVST